MILKTEAKVVTIAELHNLELAVEHAKDEVAYTEDRLRILTEELPKQKVKVANLLKELAEKTQLFKAQP